MFNRPHAQEITDTPLLSIAIPTYNRLHWLKISLPEIIAQAEYIGWNRVEVIVSDNHSNDGTIEYLNFLENKFPIYVNYNDKNIGGEGNFYLLPTLCSGKYIHMIGDDDILIPGVLERIITQLKSSPDYLILNFNVFDPKFKKCLIHNVLNITNDIIIETKEDCLNVISAMIMGFISLWVARRDFFNIVPLDKYKHFSQWGMSIQVDRYVGISTFPKGIVLSEPCLQTRQDGDFRHDYFLWFLHGGVETMRYAIEQNAMPNVFFKSRKRCLLINHALGRIHYERSRKIFNRKKTYIILREDYGDLLEFWLICIPFMYLPGLSFFIKVVKWLKCKKVTE